MQSHAPRKHLRSKNTTIMKITSLGKGNKSGMLNKQNKKTKISIGRT
jgi:hypothetical protein